MGQTPGALRLLQTVVDVAAEKNSTVVMPFPVELLRFFDRANMADDVPTFTDPPAAPSGNGSRRPPSTEPDDHEPVTNGATITSLTDHGESSDGS
jgi:hypothetical protein